MVICKVLIFRVLGDRQLANLKLGTSPASQLSKLRANSDIAIYNVELNAPFTINLFRKTNAVISMGNNLAAAVVVGTSLRLRLNGTVL